VGAGRHGTGDLEWRSPKCYLYRVDNERPADGRPSIDAGPAIPGFAAVLLASVEPQPRMAEGLREAGFCVIERAPGQFMAAAALHGEFDAALYFPEGAPPTETAEILQAGAAGLPLVIVLPRLTPELVSSYLAEGADACLQDDADDRVVAAQIQAVLRRTQLMQRPEPETIELGDLVVDRRRCVVMRGDEELPLTASEYRVIEFMARNAGRTLTPAEILAAAGPGWANADPRSAADTFKVYARRMRNKLERDPSVPEYLVTVRGLGYRLQAPGFAVAAG